MQNDPVAWIEKEFYIPETRNDPVLKGRFKFMPHQADIIREIFSKDERGMFKYDIIVWSDIKKSWKSSIAAAVTLYRAEMTEWGEFYVIANDLKQANSRVSMYIRRAIALNPKLRKKYRTQGYTITAPNGSVIEAVPIDPSGEAGSNADQVLFSELWGANEDAKQKMWTEMTIPPGKHGRAFRWVESYAGFAEESELLYSLYDLGVNHGELLWPDKLYPTTDGAPTPLEVYVNRDARMLCYWGTVPRTPDQTAEYYKSEETILTQNEFMRIHRNQWVSSTETFVPMEWWDACKREESEWPAVEVKNESFIVSLDAAVSDDTFGLWMGCRHPTFRDQVITIFSKRWKPTPGHKIDFQGTEEEPGPELVLRRLIRDYNVIQVCYDPMQLHDMTTRLRQEGLAWFKAFNQGNDRLLSDSQLRSLIRDRRFWHRGEPELREHAQNADAKIDDQDHKIRIVKRAERLKVDLLVAASMGSYELLRLNL